MSPPWTGRSQPPPSGAGQSIPLARKITEPTGFVHKVIYPSLLRRGRRRKRDWQGFYNDLDPTEQYMAGPNPNTPQHKGRSDYDD